MSYTYDKLSAELWLGLCSRGPWSGFRYRGKPPFLCDKVLHMYMYMCPTSPGLGALQTFIRMEKMGPRGVGEREGECAPNFVSVAYVTITKGGRELKFPASWAVFFLTLEEEEKIYGIYMISYI